VNGELHHAVLHDIKRGFLVADVVHAAFKGAAFGLFEEVGEF
jgi:hypothetical protein